MPLDRLQQVEEVIEVVTLDTLSKGEQLRVAAAILNSALSWASTEEGYDYWQTVVENLNKISNQYAEADGLEATEILFSGS